MGAFISLMVVAGVLDWVGTRLWVPSKLSVPLTPLGAHPRLKPLVGFAPGATVEPTFPACSTSGGVRGGGRGGGLSTLATVEHHRVPYSDGRFISLIIVYGM